MREFIDWSIDEIKSEYSKRVNESYYEAKHSKKFQQHVINCIKNGSMNATVNELFSKNGGAPIFENISQDSFRRKMSNWKNGQNFPNYVHNLDRMPYIDILLYIGIQEEKPEPLAYFNRALNELGLESLYVINYFDFCIAAAILIGHKNKQNSYQIFRQLYNDNQLKALSEKPQKIRNYDFTCFYNDDFRSINSIGSIDEIDYDMDNVTTAYQFVNKNSDEFGRNRLSAYYAFASLLSGHDLEEIVDTIMEGIYNKKVAIWEERIGKYVSYPIEEAIISQIETDEFRKNIFLISKNACISFLKYQHEALYQESNKDNHLERKSNNDLLPFDYDRDISQTDEMHKFLHDNDIEEQLNEIRAKLARSDSKEVIKLSKNELTNMIDNKENLSRNMLLLIIMTSMSNKIINNYLNAYSVKKEIASGKIIDAINEVLEKCSMSELDIETSKYDYLLLGAIYQASYEKIYKSEKIIYPYRDIVFYQLLGNNAEQTIIEMKQEITGEKDNNLR